MATPYHLPKKRGALKGTRISFLRDAFSLRSLTIHKADLFKLIFVKCLSYVFNISFNIMQKKVYWSLESRRPDFVWAEWVPNTFPFRNLASELRVFG